MNNELAYILFTPYTIARSRSGGVLSRLLVRLELDLVGAQMFAATEELAKAYSSSIIKHKKDGDKAADLLSNYVLRTFTPSGGRKHRVLFLLFRGANAVAKVNAIAGPIFNENRDLDSVRGETIRDTYGDIILNDEKPDDVEYFEPVVLTPIDKNHCGETLLLFHQFLSKQQNIVENMVYENPQKIERTLVIIKPDNWVVPSSRPGTIIDMFSRTGLRIIGTKIYQMSIAEALEFYGPVEQALTRKLGPHAGEMAAETLSEKFKIKLSDDARKSLTDSFGTAYARDQFHQIIQFMTGVWPDECPLEEINNPGKSKCMVIVYEGVDAVSKIREVLGPTDPLKAPAGTIRREFGTNVMVNTAHASDSAENAKREMEIVRINQNNISDLLCIFLGIKP